MKKAATQKGASMDEGVEYQDHEICPCGRGKPYGSCCKPKGVRWTKIADGAQQEAYVPLSPEMEEGLDCLDQQFEDLFGRSPEADDLLMFNIGLEADRYFKTTMKMFREAGIPEREIYAFYRTDGLIVTPMNEHLISQADLDLFEEYCQEYDELMGQGIQGNQINVMLLAAMVNDIVSDAIHESSWRITSALNYFLAYQTEQPGKLLTVPSTLKEYVFFLVMRTRRALRSISALVSADEPESIYSIARSLFECYVYLKCVNGNPGFFDEKIKPILASSEYGFEVEDNQIDYTKMHISKMVNENDLPRMNLRKLCKSVGPQIDDEIYDYFYKPACQFVHIDVFTARACFYEPDIFTEFDPTLVASTVALSIAVLIISELSTVEFLDERERRDLDVVSHRCAKELQRALKMLSSDPEQEEPEYHVLAERLAMIAEPENAIS